MSFEHLILLYNLLISCLSCYNIIKHAVCITPASVFNNVGVIFVSQFSNEDHLQIFRFDEALECFILDVTQYPDLDHGSRHPLHQMEGQQTNKTYPHCLCF